MKLNEDYNELLWTFNKSLKIEKSPVVEKIKKITNSDIRTQKWKLTAKIN